jgi:purine catabolism regulator
MPMPLRDVLADPTLAAADPLVLAGRAALGRVVTWVHTSEVLDIAALLRGGELLLVGGVGLATATRAQRVTYVRELAARGVAGIAIETGGRLPTVPTEMVEEADRVHLPLLELRRVVRFVEVTQAINGLLVNESVRRLQLADRVSHALAAGLADGADVGRLMGILAAEVRADAVLTAPDGEVIAEASADPERPPAADRRDSPIVAPVSSAGVTVALLTLDPRPGADLLLLDAARDRAPEALGLALLRSRPLSRLERDAHELLGLAASGGRSPRRLTELASRLGISAHDAWVCTVARIGPGHGLTAGIEAAVGRSGRTAISQIDHDSHLSVIALRLEGTTLAAARSAVLDDLRDVPLPPQVRVAVGPGTRVLTDIGQSLAEAESALDLADDSGQAVVDAVALGVPRFLRALNRPELVADLIEEQLGDLLELDRRRQGQLFETLAMYLRQAGRKTDTAAALHLQRQSLYQRLERILAALGHPAPGSDRWGAVALAVELEAARRRGLGDPRGTR